MILMDAGPARHRWSSATGHRHAGSWLDLEPMPVGSVPSCAAFASVSHNAIRSGMSDRRLELSSHATHGAATSR